jgi:hypothetical protein
MEAMAFINNKKVLRSADSSHLLYVVWNTLTKSDLERLLLGTQYCYIQELRF